MVKIHSRKIGKDSKPQRVQFQLKITLLSAPLPIWRRITISCDTPLNLLHEVFQVVMGWWDYHLHDFATNDRHFGDLESADGDKTIEDEAQFTLEDLVSIPGERFLYVYDFGDGWEHEVLLEAHIPIPQKQMIQAHCTNGKRACPPEDVGGTPGYSRFVSIIEDPLHPEQKELLTWAGGTFDPDCFDQRGVNHRLLLLFDELRAFEAQTQRTQ